MRVVERYQSGRDSQGSVVQTGQSSGEKLAERVRIGELTERRWAVRRESQTPGRSGKLGSPNGSSGSSEHRMKTGQGCGIYNIGNPNNTAGSGEGG